MDEEKLRNYFGDNYPTSLIYKRRIKERLELFPGALEVYQSDKGSLINDRNSWFLVSQLMPELVTDYGPSPDKHLRDFINSERAHTADWMSVYKFFDLYMTDGGEYGNELVDILNTHREELLNSYDMV
jgi:hypothetical protein